MDEKNLKGLKIVHRKGKCENINYQNKQVISKSLPKLKVMNNLKFSFK